jgi:hypothetical protein
VGTEAEAKPAGNKIGKHVEAPKFAQTEGGSSLYLIIYYLLKSFSSQDRLSIT